MENHNETTSFESTRDSAVHALFDDDCYQFAAIGRRVETNCDGKLMEPDAIKSRRGGYGEDARRELCADGL